MPITGSQLAYKNARSGVARSGASRSNYYTPVNVAITINAVSRTSSILIDSLRISLALNDEPDTAVFTMKPGSTIPTLFQPVKIGLGAITSPIFAGSVVTRTPRRLKVADSPFYDIQCVDWLRLFNRRRVNRIYRGAIQGATINAIVTNVITLDTSGFTFANVQASAIIPDLFIIEDETPSEILTRLVHRNGGGGWYIDPNRDVHFFGASGDPSQSVPATITDTSTTVLLSDFRHTDEGRELRNRVIVKGRSTRTLVTVPNDYTPVYAYGIPLEEGWPFFGGFSSQVNFGGQVFEYAEGIMAPDVGDATPVYVTLTADANPDDTTISVDSSFPFQFVNVLRAWAHDGDGNAFSVLADWPTFLTNLFTIDSSGSTSGYGAIKVMIPSGTRIYLASSLRGTRPLGATSDADGFDEIPIGETARVRVVMNNTSAQTALAAIEGGNGIHEHIVEAPDADYLGAGDIGQAELDLFSAATGLPIATWTTRDMNATIGSRQTFSMAGTDPFSDTLTVTRMEITFPTPNTRPFRRCEASDVKLASFADVLTKNYGDQGGGS